MNDPIVVLPDVRCPRCAVLIEQIQHLGHTVADYHAMRAELSRVILALLRGEDHAILDESDRQQVAGQALRLTSQDNGRTLLVQRVDPT